MPEYVRQTVAGKILVVRTTDAMLDELSAVHKQWQSERDYIRTILEVHYSQADPESQRMISALLHIVKGAR